MAKKRTFLEKLVSKLKRESNGAWSGEYLDEIRDLSSMMDERDDNPRHLIAPGFIQACQYEALFRGLDEKIIREQGKEDDAPLIFPGVMAAWESAPATLEFSPELLQTVREAQIELLGVSLNRVLSLFPACLLIDTRPWGLELYGVRCDGLFIYPSYDCDREYEVLHLLGVSAKQGFHFPFESRIVLQGKTFAEALDASVAEREMLRGRCLAGLDKGLHDMIFSPFEDEERIMLLAADALGVLFCPYTQVEILSGNRKVHLRAVCAPKGEGGGAVFDEPLYESVAAIRARDIALRAMEMAQIQSESTSGAELDSRAAHEHARELSDSESELAREPEAKLLSEPEPETSSEQEAKPSMPEPAPTAEPEPMPTAESEATPTTEPEPALSAESGSELEPMAEPKAEPITEPTPTTSPSELAADYGDSNACASAGVRAQADDPRVLVSSENEADIEHTVEQLEYELLDLHDRLRERESKLASLEYHLKQSRIATEAAQRAAADVRARAAILESMEIPSTPLDALELAERAFPDRLLVLPGARKSADEFVKGDVAEVWAVLRSIAAVLHPLVFSRGGGSIIHAFESQSGFEITLREMKLIKRNGEFSRLRTVRYKSEERDASAHVKGRGFRKGETLRVHFFADYDERKIVIAHCGEHLTTYDSSKF